MIKSLVLSAMFFLVVNCGLAQTKPELSKHTKDSLSRIYLDNAAILNPVLRQVTVSTDLISRGDIESKLMGEPLMKGKSSTIRTTVNLNLPVASWGKNSLAVSGTFFQQKINVSDVQSFSPTLGNEDFDFNKGTFGLTASFTRADLLFGRAVYYMASATGVTNDLAEVKRLSFLGTAVFPLKQTATTRYAAGVVVNIDPSLKIPAFLIFSYWHKFQNKIELNVTLPNSFGLRRAFSDRFWATLGTSLSGSLAFFELNQANLPRDANYTTIDLKSGLGVEYRVGKKMIFGINGGILTPLSARAFDRRESSSEYFLNNKLSNVPYVNFSFSLLPFLHKK
ncbi:DUF6268 family outer membrane beta-barrel protein [Pedobacter sp. MC2016-14]|uniref:DUF6268 family outer membrane beta-barrel protein n=1 Tax=Pedobacter sp. MC2016-14 TaxID=2897327 RepID=UPI001E628E7B|nr:DUF6268 family outer membrane beta-barrel protein [Pedobacter sp. MC2016-14]MCD0487590.1 DUF6268 family outer membrane beta-barrel protein [Pedobacter sp. MC2016-14]